MEHDPEAIKAEIAQTRERIAETVEALAYKTDISARAKDAVHDRVETAKDAVHDSVETVKHAVSDAVDTAKSAIDQTAHTVQEHVRDAIDR